MAEPSSVRPESSVGPLRWVAILLTLAAGVMIWPMWQPLVLAAWFAALARPLMNRFSRVLRGRHRAAAAVTVLLLLLVLVPIGLFAASLVVAAIELVQTLLKSQGGQEALEAIVSGGTGPDLRLGLEEIVALARQYGERAFGLVTTIAGATAAGLFGTFVFVLAAYTFLAEGARTHTWIEDHLPVAPRYFRRFAAAFNETGRGLVVGVGLTGLIQGVVATVAYLALDIPRALVLGVLTALVSFIPSVGTAFVWVPVAVGLALTGRWVSAIIMAVVGVFVIGLIDNLLRPVLSRHGSLQLPSFVLLVAMFGGLATIGGWGLVMGPLIVRLAVEALSIERGERLARANDDEPPAAAMP